MKIYDHGGLMDRIPAQAPSQKSPATPNGFAEIFRKTLGEAALPSAAVAAAGGGVAIQLPAAAATYPCPAMSRVEGFLEVLDDYRRQLADPRVDLKGLDSALQAVEKRRDALSPLLAALPEGDALKDVLNQTLVTAEIEIIRFRRGDFLPAG